ncbi:MAG TPA: EamA family transporter [Flexilinea sp.]|nr:EamA family transporter [Flexilinea sp.]HPS48150.1 EamA family transporter [Flexilinea sp.]
MNFKKIIESYHFYAIITILCWALAPVLTRLCHLHFSAMPIGFLRYLISSVLIIFLLIIKKTKLPSVKDLPWLIASAATGFSLYMVMFNYGTQYVESATTSVMMATSPLITALLSFLLFKEYLSKKQWLAILIEFVGIIILTVVGNGFSLNIGTLWLLGASFLLSVYNLIQRILTKKYSGFQVTAFSILIGTLMLSFSAPQSFRELKTAPMNQIFYLLILGIFTSTIAYIAWSTAFQKAEKTSQVSNYMFFNPLLSGIFAFFIAGEIPDSTTYIGGALILLGMCLFNYGQTIRTERKVRSR